jgi:hypothetical protein
MLFVAKNWVVPEAEYVCCDLGMGLPFCGGAFIGVICSDAFHCFENKAMVMRECHRTVQSNCMVVLTWVRNGLCEYREAGYVLPPEAYQALAGEKPHQIVPDADVLRRYLRRSGPALARSARVEELRNAATLSMVTSSDTQPGGGDARTGMKIVIAAEYLQPGLAEVEIEILTCCGADLRAQNELSG